MNENNASGQRKTIWSILLSFFTWKAFFVGCVLSMFGRSQQSDLHVRLHVCVCAILWSVCLIPMGKANNEKCTKARNGNKWVMFVLIRSTVSTAIISEFRFCCGQRTKLNYSHAFHHPPVSMWPVTNDGSTGTLSETPFEFIRSLVNLDEINRCDNCFVCVGGVMTIPCHFEHSPHEQIKMSSRMELFILSQILLVHMNQYWVKSPATKIQCILVSWIILNAHFIC